MNRHYIIPIFVPHWGCLHDCVFCNQKRITGIKEEPEGKDVTTIIEKYLATIVKSKVEKRIEVAFYGGSFTAIPIDKQQELLRPAYEALKMGLINDIRISTRPDCISEATLDLLEGYGVSIIELGVQSMDSDVLLLAGRGHTPEDVERSIALIKKRANLKLGLQMMLGLPGDNPVAAKRTALQIVELEPDFVRIYPTLVIKDTPLERLFLRGEYLPLTLDEAVELAKEVYLVFQANGIPVIRIGLQPSEEISTEGDVLAGPFHPAFRELVESSIALDKMISLIKTVASQEERIIFKVAPQDISIVRGQKNKNIRMLKESYGLREIAIVPDNNLSRREILLET